MSMGMDMGSDGMFKGTNMTIAHAFWYIVAATAGVRGTRTIIDHVRARIVYVRLDHEGESTTDDGPEKDGMPVAALCHRDRPTLSHKSTRHCSPLVVNLHIPVWSHSEVQ